MNAVNVIRNKDFQIWEKKIEKSKEIKLKLCKCKLELKISVGTHDTFSFKKYRLLIAVQSKGQEIINPPAKIISAARVVVSKYHSPLKGTRASWRKRLTPLSAAGISNMSLDSVFIPEVMRLLLLW